MPLLSYYFSVEIDGVNTSFQEVSGMEVSAELETIIEGGCPYSHRLPVRLNYNNLRLVNGLIRDEKSEFMDWISSFWPNDNIASAKLDNVKDLTISLLGTEDGEPVNTWFVYNAYPVKWSGPSFNAMENTIAIQTVELAYQRISLTNEKK